MGKERDTYRTFTTSMLKVRSSIPSAGDIAEHVGHIDCSNISLNAVSDLLDNTTHSLYALCRHANVNRWSNFGPIIRDYAGSGFEKYMTATIPTVAALGDFAGYHHDSTAPGWYSAPPTEAWVDAGSQATFNVIVRVGEIDYPLGKGVCIVLFDEGSSGGQIVGWGWLDLNSIGEYGTVTVTTDVAFFGGGISTDQIFEGRAYITTNTENFSTFDEIEPTILCEVTNCNSFVIDVKVRAQTYFILNGTAADNAQADVVGGDYSFHTPRFNLTTGQVTFAEIHGGLLGITGIRVEVTLIDNTEGAMTPIYTDVIYDEADSDGYGEFIAPNNLTNYVDPIPTAFLGMTSISNYGYIINVVVYESA